MKQTGILKPSQIDLDQNSAIATKADAPTLADLVRRMVVIEDKFDYYSKSEVDTFLAVFNAYIAKNP